VSNWFGRLFGARTAVEEGRQNPALEATVRESALIYDRIPLRNFIGEARRAELGRELYLEINRICNSRQPAAICREKYAAAMLDMASFQVLMIPPSPQKDVFELRGQPGITGELSSYLVELFKKNDRLRAAMFGEEGIIDHADYWQLLQRLYWESVWLLETLNVARIELGDSIAGECWHEMFLHAACVNAEHGYRWDLELPAAFDASISKKASNAYSMFTDIVMSGAADPAAEWREYYQGSGIPMPDSSAK
jgi:hypothetical protein